MTDQDLINRLFRVYTETQWRIDAIAKIRKRRATRFWRFKQTLKGWFK